ncbi:MAG: hypothetical protein IKB71_05620 [Lentisphaeria bacterium]|nr:hypothetical protein [Lentisphaeria bacterium]
MKKYLIFVFAVGLTLFCTSCGYHIGSTMHPQIKNIGIGKVINDTAIYNASVQLQQLLAEQFMLDGDLKVVNLGNAQTIIYSRIVNIGYTMISGRNNIDDGIYKPADWEVRAVVEYSVILPGERDPLISKRTVSGTAFFRQQADLETARARAIQMALRDAAKKIVQGTTEEW